MNVAPVLKNLAVDSSNYKPVGLMFVTGKLHDMIIKENHPEIQTKEKLHGFCKQISPIFWNFKGHEERVWMKVTLYS